MLQGLNASKVLFMYRVFGETEYKEIEMAVRGNNADVEINGDKVSLPYLECYFLVNTATAQEAYPVGAPTQSSPLQIKVAARSPKDKEVVFFYPLKKNSNIAQSEFFISVSLLRATEKVDKAATKLFVDDIDRNRESIICRRSYFILRGQLPSKIFIGKSRLAC